MVEAKAVRIDGKGEVDVLSVGALQVRDAGPGEVRVAVAAAGLNRADTLQRRGFYPAPPGVAADVPGLEFAGTVEQLGDGVTDFAIGDRVMGITGGGGMADHVGARIGNPKNGKRGTVPRDSQGSRDRSCRSGRAQPRRPGP